jgi:hypothetical protein
MAPDQIIKINQLRCRLGAWLVKQAMRLRVSGGWGPVAPDAESITATWLSMVFPAMGFGA